MGKKQYKSSTKFLLPIAAMLLCVASCQKDNSRTLTLEVEQYGNNAKMHIDSEDYAVWDNNDPISLNGQYCQVSVDNNHQKATIAIPDAVASEKTFYATYPSSVYVANRTIEWSASQTYRLNDANQQILDAPMYAEGSDRLKFCNLGALLSLTINNQTGNSINVRSIEVINQNGEPLYGTADITGNTANTPTLSFRAGQSANNCITLKCPEGALVENNQTFYISMPPIQNGKLTIKVYDDSYCYTLSQTNNTAQFDRNHIYEVRFNASNSNRQRYDRVIDGLFHVSASTVVKFAAGNLHCNYNNSTWWFAPQQYSCDNDNDRSDFDKNDISFFFGSNILNIDVAELNWINAKPGWTTLTDTEWQYVFSSRTNRVTINGTTYNNLLWSVAQVEGLLGLILFPDGSVNIPDILAFSEAPTVGNNYAAAQWAKFEAAGCVFLPAVGYRQFQEDMVTCIWLMYNTYGCYWTSTVNNENQISSALTFRIFDVPVLFPPTIDSYSLYYACSVRLVQVVN